MCSVKKGILKKFHRKAAVLESLFNKLANLKVCNAIKIELLRKCFPVKFAKFLRAPILKNICERMLRKTVKKYLHNVQVGASHLERAS